MRSLFGKTKLLPSSNNTIPYPLLGDLQKPRHARTAGGFAGLREPGVFWYDNTHTLCHLLRSGVSRKVLLTRPPRMGKTIFCQMLAAYVDRETTEEEFQRLFSGTRIERMQREDAEVRAALEEVRGKCAVLSFVSAGIVGRCTRQRQMRPNALTATHLISFPYTCRQSRITLIGPTRIFWAVL